MLKPVEWEEKARENVEDWGQQEREIILLCMQEELGELTREVLKSSNADPRRKRTEAELDDLAALMFQFYWAHKFGW